MLNNLYQIVRNVRIDWSLIMFSVRLNKGDRCAVGDVSCVRPYCFICVELVPHGECELGLRNGFSTKRASVWSRIGT